MFQIFLISWACVAQFFVLWSGFEFWRWGRFFDARRAHFEATGETELPRDSMLILDDGDGQVDQFACRHPKSIAGECMRRDEDGGSWHFVVMDAMGERWDVSLSSAAPIAVIVERG